MLCPPLTIIYEVEDDSILLASLTIMLSFTHLISGKTQPCIYVPRPQSKNSAKIASLEDSPPTWTNATKKGLTRTTRKLVGRVLACKVLLSASVTQTSSHSAKAKGREPEVSQVLVISEAEFELVMRPDLIIPTYEKKWAQLFKGEEGGK